MRKILYKVISILLVATFITGQISASFAYDNLGASLVTDPDINPDRSNALKNDIAEKAKPGAIGNGIPLQELAQGKLPPRVAIQGRERVAARLRVAISEAIKLSTANKDKVPTQHKERFQKTLDNLIDFQNKLNKRAYLYNAVVRTPEDYLLGFNIRKKILGVNFGKNIGLSLELVDMLYSISSKRLAQYIFHECVPEQGIITERDDHRVVYNEIQSVIFGQDEVLALKKNLRGFISEKLSLTSASDTAQKTTLPPGALPVLLETLLDNNPENAVGRAVLRQEKAGQEQLARSELLPMEGTSNEAEWSAIGVKLGRPKKGDPLFRHVTLPSGWKIVSMEHSMWSNLVDDKGAVRANIFYKAAFYDRRAHVSLLPAIKPIAPTEKEVAPEIVMAQISEDLPVRAAVFKANLTKMLTDHPEQLFFMGFESDIGKSAQGAQIAPIMRDAIDEIKDMKDADEKPLFPNLMVRRAKAEELATLVRDLTDEGRLNLNNAFIGARKVSVDNNVYDAIKGEGRAWISAIDDSRRGEYLPVFEAITLNMMAYLNADLTAIKNFYDAISKEPIDIDTLRDMLRKRIIYIIPKATAFNLNQLRELYELARKAYISA